MSESGSNWAKWDLHIHSPLTNLANRYKQPHEELDLSDIAGQENRLLARIKFFCKRIIDNDIKVIGLTNYFYFGFREIDRIRGVFSSKSYDVCILPNIEMRLSWQNSKGQPLHAHIIFSERISQGEISECLGALELANKDEKGNVVRCKEGIDLNHAIVDFNVLSVHLAKSFKWRVDYVIAISVEGYGGAFLKDISSENIIPIDDFIDLIGGITKKEGGSIRKENVLCRQIMVDSDLFIHASKNQSILIEKCNDIFEPCKAIFQSSDAHEFDIIGSKYSYVKAAPSFEGLKQVLLDPKERIRFDSISPEVKGGKPHFSKLEISGVAFNGEKVTFDNVIIPLNERMVAIVGGRGSGKSLLLNALHSVFLDDYVSAQQVSSRSTKPKNPKTRDANPNLVRLTLNRGLNDDIVFDNQSKKSYPYLHISQGEIKEMSESKYVLSKEIKKMLNINESIDDQVRKTVKEKAEIFISKFKSYMDDYYWKVDNKGFSKRKEFYEKEINDRRETVRSLSAKHLQDSLDKISAIANQIAIKENILTDLKDFLEKTNKCDVFFKNKADFIKDTHGISFLKLPIFNYFIEELNEKIAEIESGLLVLRNTKETEVFNISAVVLDYTSVASKVDLLNSEIRDFEVLSKKVDADLKEIQDAYSAYQAVLKNLKESYEVAENSIKNSFNSFKDGNADYTDDQNKLINLILDEINVTAFVDFRCDDFYELLESSLTMQKFREKDGQSTRERVVDLMGVNSLDSFFDLIVGKDIISISGANYNLISFCYEYYEYYFKSSGCVGFLEKLMYPEYIDKYIQPMAVMTYYNKEFEKLSVGQKGTFYVCMKLATDPFSTPFIFDQPEDDLDNEFIYNKLVPIFKKIKRYRQVIIVTHNANLVVNADADQVILAVNNNEVITYRPAAIEGMCGDARMKDEICRVLEGGESAFHKREKKYGINTGL